MISTADQWVAHQRAKVDERARVLADRHGELTIPANPNVQVRADERGCLYITVGKRLRHGDNPDWFWTGLAYTARITPNGVLTVSDIRHTTSWYSNSSEVPISKLGLRRDMTAQQVVDRLATLIGPDQCHVCGRHGDHTPGTDEAPYCVLCCPTCNPEEAA